jgi:hypothetical protein
MDIGCIKKNVGVKQNVSVKFKILIKKIYWYKMVRLGIK